MFRLLVGERESSRYYVVRRSLTDLEALVRGAQPCRRVASTATEVATNCDGVANHGGGETEVEHVFVSGSAYA